MEASVAGSSFTLKNAAPGTCFALFGVLIIAVMFAAGSPQLTLHTIAEASGLGGQAGSTGANRGAPGPATARLIMRGPDTEVLTLASLTQRGINHELHGDTVAAIAAYGEAVSTVAAPMNYLAWLYLQKGRLEDALTLSRVAVSLAPDSASFLDTLAEALYDTGDFPEALVAMEQAADLDGRYESKLVRFRGAGNR